MQILETMRTTRDELRQEEEDAREQAELAAAAAAGSPAAPHSPGVAASGRKRRRGEKLREDAANRILQLRLACVHPQLTKHWQQLSTDLQLNMGGTLSMEVRARRAGRQGGKRAGVHGMPLSLPGACVGHAPFVLQNGTVRDSAGLNIHNHSPHVATWAPALLSSASSTCSCPSPLQALS